MHVAVDRVDHLFSAATAMEPKPKPRGKHIRRLTGGGQGGVCVVSPVGVSLGGRNV